MNNQMNAAKANRNDEFYTMSDDVCNELVNYELKGKVVYCNCDDIKSEFVQYFINNFRDLNIKYLYATSFNPNGKGKFLSYDGTTLYQSYLKDDGDFRGKDARYILSCSDVVVTNPPFSLFRDFIDLMTLYQKKYLIVGTYGAVIYKNVFPLVRDGELWTGYNLIKKFITPSGEVAKFGNICWWTNLKGKKEKVWNPTYMGDSNEYQVYDNYDALNVPSLKLFPNYKCYKALGVPISYILYHNPSMYRILGVTSSSQENSGECHMKGTSTAPYIKGKKKFARIIIKRIFT